MKLIPVKNYKPKKVSVDQAFDILKVARRASFDDRKTAVALMTQVAHSVPSISAAGLFEVDLKLIPTVRIRLFNVVD